MKSPWFKEEHEIFRKTVRSFMEKELAPHSEEWEEKKDFPDWVFKRTGEMGFLGITYRRSFGIPGGEQPPFEFRLLPPPGEQPRFGEGERPFRIPIPDFNFKSLRVNAVLRWEFRPGSAAYVVWTQRRQDGRNPGSHAFGRDLGDLFAAPADDVFMVKLAWWLGR